MKRCSKIITNTPLLFLFLYSSVLLKMANIERRWRYSRNGYSFSPWPLQRGVAAGSGPLALPGKEAGPKGPALFAVSVLKGTTQAKSPLDASPGLITPGMLLLQTCRASRADPAGEGRTSPTALQFPGSLTPRAQSLPTSYTPGRKRASCDSSHWHQSFRCLPITLLPVSQSSD